MMLSNCQFWENMMILENLFNFQLFLGDFVKIILHCLFHHIFGLTHLVLFLCFSLYYDCVYKGGGGAKGRTQRDVQLNDPI